MHSLLQLCKTSAGKRLKFLLCPGPKLKCLEVHRLAPVIFNKHIVSNHPRYFSFMAMEIIIYRLMKCVCYNVKTEKCCYIISKNQRSVILLTIVTYSIYIKITNFSESNSQYKSYSLTGNAANQLSQSVRERLMLGSQSLPKGVGQDYALVMRQGRPKASDGSLSDTQAIDTSSPYAPWLRHR